MLPARVETVTVFLPDTSSCVADTAGWQTAVDAYMMSTQSADEVPADEAASATTPVAAVSVAADAAAASGDDSTADAACSKSKEPPVNNVCIRLYNLLRCICFTFLSLSPSLPQSL